MWSSPGPIIDPKSLPGAPITTKVKQKKLKIAFVCVCAARKLLGFWHSRSAENNRFTGGK